MRRQKQGFLIHLVLAGVLILSLVLPDFLRAADREAEINTRIRELTYESAYLQERAKTIQYEARDLGVELKAIKEAKEAKEKEDKKNEKKK